MYCTDIMVDDVEQHTLGQPKRVTVHLVVAVLQKGYGAFYGQRACRWSSPLHFVMANAPKPCSGMQSLFMLEVTLSEQYIVRHHGG